jgi:hypothetical protein
VITEVWKLPVPATALLAEPAFAQFPGRRCELSFNIEGENGEPRKVCLLFDGVEAYKCTYLTSLTQEMINVAYGKLVRLGMTPWLIHSLDSNKKFSAMQKKDLQHLMICFDDGPCYEFICADFGDGP